MGKGGGPWTVDRGPSAGVVAAVGGVGKAAVAPAAAPVKRVVLEGYVKGGVVHLLEGELPDGVFVKVIRE
jgi:probable phosphoglycerate mutase